MSYERTLHIRQELLHLLERLDEQDLNKKLDGWTIAEIIAHLYLTERKFVQIMKEAIKQQRALTDKTNPNFDLSFMMDRSRKINAPDDISPTEKSYTKNELLTLLSESREMLNEVVATTPSTDWDRLSSPHRWMGDLTVKKWIELIGQHEKRHLLQIDEILHPPIGE